MDEAYFYRDSPYVIDNVGRYKDELELLLSIATIKRYGPGEIVYMQGERSKCFYFINKGKAKLSILKEDGSEKIIAIQENNTFFGESAAFDRYHNFSTVTTLEESELYVITIDSAERLIQQHPSVAFLIITTIARKVRLLGLQIENISFFDAQKRIAHILVKLSYQVGQDTHEGITIRKNITHEDIASLTGLSRVTATNTLNRFEKLKLIKKGRKMITIIDRDRLASFLDEDTAT
ncbi:MAG: cAMP-activated global transcriptional regulator CRP [Syntrophorhabdus sp. PtaU1.Bin058]|nr:MAG: cAMP-activated global transcriptional regulator CRP [Syntrophorhabdus sp. PtaU1.Bin058]